MQRPRASHAASHVRAPHLRSRNRIGRSFARRAQDATLFVITCFALALFATSVAAEPATHEARAAKSLDEQVQEIKSDVLAIAAELGNLEERLLFPSNTQIAVFVALEEGDSVAIDAARISIDGEFVAHHIYSFKELEALKKGGVQRIYTGNVPTGSHQLEVVISGKRGSSKDFEIQQAFAFDKQVDPKLVGVTLGSSAAGNTTIAIEDW